MNQSKLQPLPSCKHSQDTIGENCSPNWLKTSMGSMHGRSTLHEFSTSLIYTSQNLRELSFEITGCSSLLQKNSSSCSGCAFQPIKKEGVVCPESQYKTSLSSSSHLEQFSILRSVKPKPKYSLKPISKDPDNTVNQSKLEIMSRG